MSDTTLDEIALVGETIAQIGLIFVPGGTPVFNAILLLAKAEPEAAALFMQIINRGRMPSDMELAALTAAVAARKQAEARSAIIDQQIAAEKAASHT